MPHIINTQENPWRQADFFTVIHFASQDFGCQRFAPQKLLWGGVGRRSIAVVAMITAWQNGDGANHVFVFV
jgi:hypothetical protein